MPDLMYCSLIALNSSWPAVSKTEIRPNRTDKSWTNPGERKQRHNSQEMTYHLSNCTSLGCSFMGKHSVLTLDSCLLCSEQYKRLHRPVCVAKSSNYLHVEKCWYKYGCYWYKQFCLHEDMKFHNDDCFKKSRVIYQKLE